MKPNVSTACCNGRLNPLQEVGVMKLGIVGNAGVGKVLIPFRKSG